MSNIYLSICIPTNGRLEILKKTLDSIFINCEVSFSDFEVVISDNSTDNLLEELLTSYKEFPNIIYSKTNSEGFLNSVNALNMGQGLFLKLHNNYTIFKKGGLKQIIAFIKNETIDKPVTFFTNGVLKNSDIMNFDNFNSFTSELSYWNTWSTGFAIWKEDLEKYSQKDLNKMFPHTSLLLRQNDKKSFLINNESIFINQEVSQKGGYNLFKTFGVDYLLMMKELEKKSIISSNTFKKIKSDLFNNFFVEWYFNTKIKNNNYTYDLTDIRGSIKEYYSINEYYYLIFLSYLLAFKVVLYRIINFVRK
ncbi:MAG: glycosyltransferase [Flavobacterium sp.]